MKSAGHFLCDDLRRRCKGNEEGGHAGSASQDPNTGDSGERGVGESIVRGALDRKQTA